VEYLKKQGAKKKLALFVVFGLVLLVFGVVVSIMSTSFYPQTESIYKKAVTQNEIESKKYILCKVARTTGYRWELVQNEYKETGSEYVLLKGPDPQQDPGFSPDFYQNTFVFYITEKNTVFRAELEETCFEYTVNGWDILYPVDHGTFPNFYPGFMLESDIVLG
jgi:hypothetical protein